MEEILTICGDIDTLRKMVEDLPPKRFTPIASKKGGAIVAKISNRQMRFAIVHKTLADGDSLPLRQELKATFPGIKILLLGCTEKDEFSDAVLRYPVPGPVLRNAISSVYPAGSKTDDMEQWRAFNKELNRMLESFKAQSYYQILGLQNSAPHHALVDIYDQLSNRYHPDRYATIGGTKWGDVIISKVTTLYQLIVEAYSILSNRRSRKQYDEELKKGNLRMTETNIDDGPKSLFSTATNTQSKKFLKLAQADLAKKNWAAALQNLRFAQSMEDNPLVGQKIAELEQKLK